MEVAGNSLWLDQPDSSLKLIRSYSSRLFDTAPDDEIAAAASAVAESLFHTNL
jgi:hypothetical protein